MTVLVHLATDAVIVSIVFDSQSYCVLEESREDFFVRNFIERPYPIRLIYLISIFTSVEESWASHLDGNSKKKGIFARLCQVAPYVHGTDDLYY